MAEPEKAIIDYLYYHHEMDDADAFDEWRIDSDEVRMVIDREKLEYYGQRYSNQKLRERVNRFIAYIYEDVV
ncbi:MAG: hypothetical protein H6766_04385 [Candidatus Peribacteria bacterium]|nr:MAG: hypothetical protein H6766_04385 [Candidatus Peribacteria bacterium]